MEDRTAPCSVLLIGENPSDTAAIERVLSEVHPGAPVTIARHHQDVTRALSTCGPGAFRAAFIFPSTYEDAELLTMVRSAPGSASTRFVVLLPDQLAHNTKPFYQRGAHSVLRWPSEHGEQDQLARRAIVYWEELNLPITSSVETAERNVAVI